MSGGKLLTLCGAGLAIATGLAGLFITVRTLYLAPDSQPAGPQLIDVRPVQIDVGKVDRSVEVSAPILITNVTSHPVNLQLESTCGCVHLEKYNIYLLGGQASSVRVRVRPSGLKMAARSIEPFSRTIHVSATGEGGVESRRISVVGTLVEPWQFESDELNRWLRWPLPKYIDIRFRVLVDQLPSAVESDCPGVAAIEIVGQEGLRTAILRCYLTGEVEKTCGSWMLRMRLARKEIVSVPLRINLSPVINFYPSVLCFSRGRNGAVLRLNLADHLSPDEHTVDIRVRSHPRWLRISGEAPRFHCHLSDESSGNGELVLEATIGNTEGRIREEIRIPVHVEVREVDAARD